MTFQHPERLLGSAPVADNYNQNSCMNEGLFSSHASKAQLPIKGFYGEKDKLFGAGGEVFYKWENAKKEGLAHGFKNISETSIKDKAHEPMPSEVLNWFYRLWNRKTETEQGPGINNADQRKTLFIFFLLSTLIYRCRNPSR